MLLIVLLSPWPPAPWMRHLVCHCTLCSRKRWSWALLIHVRGLYSKIGFTCALDGSRCPWCQCRSATFREALHAILSRWHSKLRLESTSTLGMLIESLMTKVFSSHFSWPFISLPFSYEHEMTRALVVVFFTSKLNLLLSDPGHDVTKLVVGGID